MQSIEINKILELLPHRYPFVLVDRVIDYKAFEYLTAIKNVTFNEPFFTGHFPENPVMPGVLMIEALAQASGLLWSVSEPPKEGSIYFFAGINNVKFRKIVTPGDQLRLEIKFLNSKHHFWRVQAEAFVGESLACSCELLSAVKEVEK